MKTPILKNATRSLILALALAAFLVAIVSPAGAAGRWVSGDINTHSYLADGKKPFGEILAELIIRPAGKPVLVKATDKRPELNSAATDFKEETEP